MKGTARELGDPGHPVQLIHPALLPSPAWAEERGWWVSVPEPCSEAPLSCLVVSVGGQAKVGLA